MKVLVTGGNGFIGQHLVESLILDGINVIALDRKTNNLETLKEKIKIVRNDLSDIRSLQKVVDDVDIVYHLAAEHLAVSAPDKNYINSNVRGTENLLKASQSAGVKRFVHCSTVGVYGHIANPPANESYPFNPTNIYEKTKLEGEKLALVYCKETGLPVTVIRPAFVYGPREPRTIKLLHLIKNGKFIMIGNGKNLRHPIYIDDLVKSFKLCTKADRSKGEDYIIADERAVTLSEMIVKMAEVLDVKPPTLSMPVWLAKTAAYILEPTL
jgi:nucleoside-diphosphate-sugar epimerase